jgi:prophage regulatory protein
MAVSWVSRTPPSLRSAALPDTGFLRQAQSLTFVPFSKLTLWRRVVDGSFPAQVKLSVNIWAWRIENVGRWIDDPG